MGEVPWGTHLCQFYQSKEELLEVIVPYFKTGLKNNELCIWITSESLSVDEARVRLAKAVRGFRHHLRQGQIEIIPHTEWYIRNGVFEMSTVSNGWAKKLERARHCNYNGIRVTGDTSWLSKKDWGKFVQYEHAVNTNIVDYPILAICTYPYTSLGVSEALDVIGEHHSAFIKRAGKWVCVNNSDGKTESGDFAPNLILSNTPDPIMIINPDTSIRYVNPAFEELTGFSWQEINGRKTPYPWWTDDTLALNNRRFVIHGQKGSKGYDVPFQRRDSEQRWAEIYTVPVVSHGQLKYYLSSWRDITGRKRLQRHTETYAAEITRAHEEQLKRIAYKLHEDIVQSLATLCISTDGITKSAKQQSSETVQRLQELRTGMVNVLKDLGSLSHDLWPAELDILGWETACKELVIGLNDKGIESRLEITGMQRSISSHTALLLIRVIQEALKNVTRHAEGTRVVVSIRFAKKRIKVTIYDNGKGFRVPDDLSDFAGCGKLGLLTMKERVRISGGSFNISSQPGEGTKIDIELNA